MPGHLVPQEPVPTPVPRCSPSTSTWSCPLAFPALRATEGTRAQEMSAWWRTLDFSELSRLSQVSRDARALSALSALSERCSPAPWLLLLDTGHFLRHSSRRRLAAPPDPGLSFHMRTQSSAAASLCFEGLALVLGFYVVYECYRSHACVHCKFRAPARESSFTHVV